MSPAGSRAADDISLVKDLCSCCALHGYSTASDPGESKVSVSSLNIVLNTDQFKPFIGL